MSLRDDLAALDATPAEGWTAADRAEHQAWVATWPAEVVADDPDAFTIAAYFGCRAVDAALRAYHAATDETAGGREAEMVLRWLAAEDEADAGDIPL